MKSITCKISVHFRKVLASQSERQIDDELKFIDERKKSCQERQAE